MAGLEGRTLDRYKLQQLMGRGGMADVYVSYDPRFEREVAVKVFKREDEDLLRRFVREAQLMASLSNPHLMPVYDAGTAALDGVNLYYIVMPLMEGGTLRSLIRRSPLSLKDACRYLRDISQALDYMHRQGIIHRDIKSSNVLLDADGRCYLSDFGIARATTDSTQMTSTGNVLGTVDYMAPELFESNHKADARSDLYSLGILLYEMVTGHLPFTAEHQIAVVAMHVSKSPPAPHTFVPDLPPQVEQVMMRGLEKQPALRYANATELADAFCQATTAPRVATARLTNPMWGQETRVAATAETRREGPLMVPPSPISTTTAPSPLYAPGMTGRYASAYAPGNRPSQVYQPQPVRSPTRTQGRIVIVMALIALLAVLGPVTYVLLTHPFSNGTNQKTSSTVNTLPNLTATTQAMAGQTQTATAQQAANASATAATGATATAQAHAQATQQAKNASATAVARATATTVANATATAGVVRTATSGTAEYSDSMKNQDDQSLGWDQTGNCSFKPDGYHVTLSAFAASQLVGCHEAARQFQDFTAQVDVTMQSGHSGGLFFRLSTNALGDYAGYLFEIDSNGHYKISDSNAFNAGSKALQNWTASSALNTGTATNTLTVIAHGSALLFYANGTFLTNVVDANFTTGDLGFVATTANGTDANIIYSNVNVYPA